MGASHSLNLLWDLSDQILIIGKGVNDIMFKQSKTLLIILAVTGFARVFIFAIPVVALYFGLNSDTNEQINER